MKKRQGTPMALPVFSVATVEEAESLKIMSCKKTYPPNSRHVINHESGFDQTIESFDQVTVYLAKLYERMKK